MKQKVIVIGMQRTGTTTLGQALIMLGYDVVATVHGLDKYLLNDNIDKVLDFADQFDAYQDLPWIFLYKELDKKYPNAKFILTKRDEQAWLQSMLNHFSNSDTKMREWAYGAGCPKANEDLYLEKFRNHQKDVLDYFKDRKDDLLILETGKDFGWDKICPFLSVPIPKKKFPFENKNKAKYSLKEKLYSRIVGLLPEIARKKILIAIGRKKRLDRFNTKHKTD